MSTFVYADATASTAVSTSQTCALVSAAMGLRLGSSWHGRVQLCGELVTRLRCDVIDAQRVANERLSLSTLGRTFKCHYSAIIIPANVREALLPAAGWTSAA